MMVGLTGYLGLMGDAENLAVQPQLLQQVTHHFGGGAADADVHLVKDQGGRGAGPGGDHLDGQADSAQLAPRGDPAEGQQRAAGSGAQQKFDPLQPSRVGQGFLPGRQRRDKATALHGQGLQLLFDLAAQGGCRLVAELAEPVGVAAPVGGQPAAAVLQFCQAVVALFEAAQFGPEAGVQGRQFLGLDAVLARQLIQGAQPLFHLVQASRIQLEVIHEVPQAAGGFLHLDVGALQQGEGLGQRLGQLGQLGQGPLGLVQDAEGVDLALLAQPQGSLTRLEEGLAAGQLALFGFQQGQLLGAGLEGVQLLHLVAQQLLPRLQLALVLLQGLDALGQLAVFARQPGAVPDRLLGPGHGIQQAGLVVALQQGLLAVLAVDVDQQAAQLAKILKGGGAAVDVAPGAAIAADDAAQQALAAVSVGQIPVLQPAAGLGDVLQIEQGMNFGLAGTGMDGSPVGPLPQDQRQRPQQDGFSRSGLAGQRRHASLEVDVDLFGDGIVFYAQMQQHGPDLLRDGGLYVYTVVRRGLATLRPGTDARAEGWGYNRCWPATARIRPAARSSHELLWRGEATWTES